MKIPLKVKILAKFIPLCNYEGNIANGEIEKLQLIKSQKRSFKFRHRLVGSKGGYDYIWEYIIDDWVKVVGKSKE